MTIARCQLITPILNDPMHFFKHSVDYIIFFQEIFPFFSVVKEEKANKKWEFQVVNSYTSV